MTQLGFDVQVLNRPELLEVGLEVLEVEDSREAADKGLEFILLVEVLALEELQINCFIGDLLER